MSVTNYISMYNPPYLLLKVLKFLSYVSHVQFFLYFLWQIIYSVICPDIDPLTSAAADFFQQLGTGEYMIYLL